ncbi:MULTISPECIES: transporter [unclassified Lentimicrobium]|uniref:transporter n=1 Tax=unclassified Lentimicrobium TaxID=2677434 RepID=UPI00155471DB|nr:MULTISPECIES: transporter [unclassified Lentimicrobium]NPD46463.1 transporter [Lentimicrobium sp. S6]NPD86603.1 transporter [Lentimicrobium sp. L6]
MKKIFLTSIIIISSYVLFAQIGGVSNSKLASLNATTIDHHIVEFEPSVSHIISHKVWNNEGQLQDLYGSSDSVFKSTGLGFRFTYGLWDKVEIGGSISTDLAMTGLGVKYNFWGNDKMDIAAVAGANIPLGNKTIDNTIKLSDNLTSVGGGFIYSAYFNEKFTLDAAAQYLFFAEKTEDEHKGSLYLNTDVGYYVFDQNLQLIVGAGYQNSSFNQLNSNTVSVYPGITVETGKRYVLILQAPFDIAGKNARKNFGISFSLTISID